MSTRFSLSVEMSMLTRDGTAESVTRDQTLRHERGQENINFPCSADHEQDWQPYTNKVIKFARIMIHRADEVLDTSCGGLIFSVFDLFAWFIQLTLHPDDFSLTAFRTPNRLYEWMCMSQGAAGAPPWFVSIMQLVTTALDNIWIYLEDAIGSEDSPINQVATLAAFLARLNPHKLKLSPNKSRSEPRKSTSWATPSLKMVSTLAMTKSPLCLACPCLQTSNNYYYKSLSNIARRIRPITVLLKSGATFDLVRPI